MTPTIEPELSVEEVLDFWKVHTLAGYDVTNYDFDDNAHWRDRALTIEDAIFFLLSQKAGSVKSIEWFDFGSVPPAKLPGNDIFWVTGSTAAKPIHRLQLSTVMLTNELAESVKALIPDYEQQLAEREAEAAEVYAHSGDMV